MDLTPLLVPLALLVERIAGYPQRLLKSIGHPVMWFGAFIGWMETRDNRPERSPQARRQAGIAMLTALLLLVLAATLAIVFVTRNIPFGWIGEAVLASALLAQKELARAVRAVADALGASLADGREAVSRIVGRDPQALDEAGVSRAAIESLAESTSDGVIAPLFWLVLLGFPGIALYKAINTADSMVGHLSDRYRDYGWASAKLDDWVNFIPARLAGALIVAAAFVTSGDARRAWVAMRRDAGRHASPNAGWPEAAMAGALGFALGGPRSYEGVVVDLPRFGDGRAALGPDDIRTALRLYATVLNLALAAVLAIAVIWVLV